jgi:hypothetical protein
VPKTFAALALFSWLLALSPLGAWGQAAPLIPRRTCATQAADDRQQVLLQRWLPGYRATKLARTTLRAQRTAAATYTLPVVVHVIHSGEAVGTGTNLSQVQVQSQLDVLNEDYRNRNADRELVPSAFKPVRADAQVQFVAALIDPSGRRLPEPGIDRVSRVAKGFAAPPFSPTYIDEVIKPSTDWDPSQYVNIWVLDLSDKLLGYAQFPDNTAGLGGLSALGGAAATDGVVVLYSAFGRVGTLSPRYDKGRTLTHELGHWLGLRHTWGDAECGDDYCADIPTQQTGNFNCPAFPHVTCSNGASGDMFMNYLDYVDDACMHLFSADQKERIQAVLAAGTPRRSELLTSPALCPNVAPATASTSGPACPGDAVQLTASGPAGATYTWAGPGGFASTQQNPVLLGVTAATAGVYTVVVTVASGACPGAASTTVVVGSPPPTPGLATSAASVCPGSAVLLTAPNLAGATLTYSWSLVSGDGLPATASAASLQVLPTQNSVYRLTVGYPGAACTSTATIGIAVVQPVWTGAAGTGNWFDAANWTGCVPTRLADATIPAGLATPYPIIGAGTAEVRSLAQLGSLTLVGGELALYGDYVGTGPFTQTGGTVATRGLGSQRLRGGSYGTLLVAGAGIKRLDPATISQRLQLAGAVLTTDNGALTLGPIATISETDTSYVLGQVQTSHEVGLGIDTFGGLGLTLWPTSTLGRVTVVRTTGQRQGAGSRGLSISRYYDLTTEDSQRLPSATLSLGYLPHELHGLPTDQLVLFKSTDASATWSNEGASGHDAAGRVSRRYVPDLRGRWTLGNATAPLTPAAASAYVVTALPVPFAGEGLALQVTTALAGPLHATLYDVLGRVVYDRSVAQVAAGTSLVGLPGSGQLPPAKYLLVVQQAGQTTHLSVARE